MKHSSFLALMEQLVLVLVFAVTAAICLGVFTASGRIAQDTGNLQQGALMAQNAAELLKSGQDPSLLQEDGFRLEVLELPSPAPGLMRQALIQVYEGEELVFSLETGWQEELP